VRVAWDELRKDAERVYYAGISLGALLGLKLAMEEGWGVRAMALMATPVCLGSLEGLMVPLVRYSPLRWLIRSVPKDFERSVADPDGRRRYEESSLPSIPTKSVFEISDLQREVMAGLARVTSPILMLHSRDDRVAPPKNVEVVKKAVSSDIVEEKFMPRARHVLTMDYGKEEAAESVVDFFGRFA
jgi:carboxylesterase